jgi:hypothetical protein
VTSALLVSEETGLVPCPMTRWSVDCWRCGLQRRAMSVNQQGLLP